MDEFRSIKNAIIKEEPDLAVTKFDTNYFQITENRNFSKIKIFNLKEKKELFMTFLKRYSNLIGILKLFGAYSSKEIFY